MATLIAEHASIPPGGTTRVGVLFEIEEGWHIYADPPGDAGLPTTVTWSVSVPETSDFVDTVFGPLQYPAPEEFLDPGDIRTFGYSGTVVISSTMTVFAKLHNAGLPIMADVRWLACKDICIPGKADLDLVLPLSPDLPATSTHAHFFTATSEL
ncbi:MAG: protein-disulfide reductase DsbD family protein [Candidatus Omnitrophota bacterium]|nr:protein-disulfide reductase DsbD family protein [Candidatus Omnitrophota bacterium]